MKPLAPRVIRKGAVVRVAGDQDTRPAAATALSYVDLRYDDGHIERWLGPGDVTTLARPADSAVEWGERVIATQGGCLIEELEMSFSDVPRDLAVPVEIVVEWNAHSDGT